MIHYHHFAISEMAIRQSIHQAIGERIELLTSVGLRNTRPSPAACWSERRHGDVGWAGERRTRRTCEIYVKFPKIEAVRSEVEEESGRARRRRTSSIQIRR